MLKRIRILINLLHGQTFLIWNQNYGGALSVNLEEHKTRTTEKVLERVEKSLKLAIRNGYRAIRSHIDIYKGQSIDIWVELFKLQKKFSSELTLQYVALAPLEFWDTTDGEDLARIFSSSGGTVSYTHLTLPTKSGV